MQVQGFGLAKCVFGLVVFGIIVAASPQAQAQSWKPTLGDADELYDAAEDLHDRAQRFRDGHTLPVTAQLEQLTADLYQLLKRNACAVEVVAALNATGATLEEASLSVALSCHLRDDRKAQSELANAQRYFAATAERVQCALQSQLPRRPVYHAPLLPTPAPIWYQVPANRYPSVDPPAPPYGYEVRRHAPAPSTGRALARVVVQRIAP